MDDESRVKTIAFAISKLYETSKFVVVFGLSYFFYHKYVVNIPPCE